MEVPVAYQLGGSKVWLYKEMTSPGRMQLASIAGEQGGAASRGHSHNRPVTSISLSGQSSPGQNSGGDKGEMSVQLEQQYGPIRLFRSLTSMCCERSKF